MEAIRSSAPSAVHDGAVAGRAGACTCRADRSPVERKSVADADSIHDHERDAVSERVRDMSEYRRHHGRRRRPSQPLSALAASTRARVGFGSPGRAWASARRPRGAPTGEGILFEAMSLTASTGDPIADLIIEGRASTVEEAEELYLDLHLSDGVARVDR